MDGQRATGDWMDAVGPTLPLGRRIGTCWASFERVAGATELCGWLHTSLLSVPLALCHCSTTHCGRRNGCLRGHSLTSAAGGQAGNEGNMAGTRRKGTPLGEGPYLKTICNTVLGSAFPPLSPASSMLPSRPSLFLPAHAFSDLRQMV